MLTPSAISGLREGWKGSNSFRGARGCLPPAKTGRSLLGNTSHDRWMTSSPRVPTPPSGNPTPPSGNSPASHCAPCPKSFYLWDFPPRFLRATATYLPAAHQTQGGVLPQLRTEGARLGFLRRGPEQHLPVQPPAEEWRAPATWPAGSQLGILGQVPDPLFSVFSSIKRGHDSWLQVCGGHYPPHCRWGAPAQPRMAGSPGQALAPRAPVPRSGFWACGNAAKSWPDFRRFWGSRPAWGQKTRLK